MREARTVLGEATTELTTCERKRLTIEHQLTSRESNLNRLKENTAVLTAELKTATDTYTEVQRAETQLKGRTRSN